MTHERGCFLVMEGIDGCGKTTQLQRLVNWLPTSGLMPPGTAVVQTREPGGTALGQALRQVLLHPPDAAEPGPVAELLLYAADRAQHVDRVIRPALERGDWVLSDRFAGSTLAYQGYGRQLDRSLIEQLEQIATGGLGADATLWLNLPLELSLARRADQSNDRIESAGQLFLQRVCDGFEALAKARDWWVIDAAQSPDAVTEQICNRLTAAFSGQR
ncbi:MAG: dTMP kinase [Synechococcus sp. NAT40]|nr:dTMP kinase [Synechococcus sp. NAT40]